MISILFTLALAAVDPKLIVAANGAKPVGPYSPAVQAGEYLYVSGQGVRDSQGKMPEGIEAQTRQCLDNVKALLDAGGMALSDAVAVQIYLLDLKHRPLVEKLFREYGGRPNARNVIWLGVARMPTETTVEITVYARKGVDRKATGVSVDYVEGTANQGVVGVAALAASAKKEAWSFRAGPAPLAFCPVVNSDPSGSVEDQTKSAFAKLEACLKQKGSSLDKVVATNVYLDNIDDFAKMNGVYATYFTGVKPSRTTVQPLAPGKSASKVRIAALAVH